MTAEGATGMELKLARVSARVTQEQIARQMGLERSRVAHIEASSRPTTRVTRRYRAALRAISGRDVPSEDRLAAAVRELVDAIRAEVRAEGRADPAGPERLLDLREAADRLGIGRTSVYAEIQAGRLRSIKVGRRRLIPASAVAAYTGRDG